MTPFQEGEQLGQESPSLVGYEQNPYAEGTADYKAWSLGFCKGYADQDVTEVDLVSI